MFLFYHRQQELYKKSATGIGGSTSATHEGVVPLLNIEAIFIKGLYVLPLQEYLNTIMCASVATSYSKKEVARAEGVGELYEVKRIYLSS